MLKKYLKRKEVVMTKGEACHLLKIRFKNLNSFESAAKISGKGSGYTFLEFSRLRRTVANLNALLDEEEGIGR